MKKVYSSLLFLLGCSLTMVAQPTLDSANFIPSIGNSQVYFIADSNAVVDPTVGASVTWDYTQLKGYGTQTTLYTIDPATTNYGPSNFPNSNYSDTTLSNGTNVSYYLGSNADVRSLGYILETGLGDAIISYSIDDEVIMQFPFTYNDNISDTYSGALIISGNPNALSGNVTVQADGHGTLQMPFGQNFTNVLRVKRVESATATTPLGTVNINGTMYSYYDPATSKLPILSFVQTNVTGAITLSFNTVQSQVALNPGASINEFKNDLGVEVYPNPASNNATVSLKLDDNDEVNIKLINELGQDVKTVFAGSLLKGNIKMDVPLNGLDKGIYFVKISTKNSENVQKLIVR